MIRFLSFKNKEFNAEKSYIYLVYLFKKKKTNISDR